MQLCLFVQHSVDLQIVAIKPVLELSHRSPEKPTTTCKRPKQSPVFLPTGCTRKRAVCVWLLASLDFCDSIPVLVNSDYLQKSGYNSYMLDQALLASAATGPPLSTHLPLHQGELLDYSGGRPDHYVTHGRPGCGTSGVRRVAKPCTCWIRLR